MGVAESKNLRSKASTRESCQVYKGSQLENAVLGATESKNVGSEAPMRESSQVYKGSQLDNAVLEGGCGIAESGLGGTDVGKWPSL